MVALTILTVMILCTSIGSIIAAGVVYLQGKELDKKYSVLVQHYYEPVTNVANTLKEDTKEEEFSKIKHRTPFDIIDDLLEGRAELDDEAKRTME